MEAVCFQQIAGFDKLPMTWVKDHSICTQAMHTETAGMPLFLQHRAYHCGTHMLAAEVLWSALGQLGLRMVALCLPRWPLTQAGLLMRQLLGYLQGWMQKAWMQLDQMEAEQPVHD